LIVWKISSQSLSSSRSVECWFACHDEAHLSSFMHYCHAQDGPRIHMTARRLGWPNLPFPESRFPDSSGMATHAIGIAPQNQKGNDRQLRLMMLVRTETTSTIHAAFNEPCPRSRRGVRRQKPAKRTLSQYHCKSNVNHLSDKLFIYHTI
jgi:hypothetical protein